MKIAGFVLLLVGLSSFAFAGVPASAPEVDAGLVGSAFVLIGGATLIIRNRLRR